MFDIRREDGTPVMAHLLSLTPLRRIVKDYFMICDSYYKAIRTATPSQIEAIDMGRRGLHNEGSELLMERLKEKIERRLRHRAAAVHADLRAALEGVSDGAPRAPQGRRRCCSPAGSIRCARRWRPACSSSSSAAPMWARPACARASSIRSRSPRMDELGLDIAKHKPMTFEELEEWEGLELRPDRDARRPRRTTRRWS